MDAPDRDDPGRFQRVKKVVSFRGGEATVGISIKNLVQCWIGPSKEQNEIATSAHEGPPRNDMRCLGAVQV